MLRNMLCNIRNIQQNPKIQESKDVRNPKIQKSKNNCTTRKNLHGGSGGIFGFLDFWHYDGGSWMFG